jgi:hypothetical protein
MTGATTLLCLVCGRREYERAHVCDADRASIPATLDRIRSLYVALRRVDVAPARRGESVKVSGGNVDPVAPINLDVVDLQAPANGYDYTKMPSASDQIGHVPVDTVLRAWVREFIRWRGRPERMPGAYTFWLADRSEWACDAYPNVGRYVAAIRKLENTLTHVTGVPKDDTFRIGHCPGGKRTPCGAELRGTVHQTSVECSRCGRRWDRLTWLNLGVEGVAA